ncbi:MAG: hypothetical protein MJZ16_03965 [Bacteroidales bacterium]|nr:hypothetical protein [Bacteroidales bacterium]
MKKLILLLGIAAVMCSQITASAQSYKIWDLSKLSKHLSGQSASEFVVVSDDVLSDKALVDAYEDCLKQFSIIEGGGLTADVKGIYEKVKDKALGGKTWLRVEHMGNGYFMVSNDDKKWGIMNGNGDITVPLEYKFTDRDVERKLVSAKNDAGVCALMTFDGEKITDFKYYGINMYYGDLPCFIAMDKGGNYMILTLEGKEVSSAYYEMEAIKVDGKWFARVANKAKQYGLLTMEGKLAISLKYRSISKVNELDYGGEEDKDWIGGFVGTTTIDLYDPETLKMVKSIKQN